MFYFTSTWIDKRICMICDILKAYTVIVLSKIWRPCNWVVSINFTLFERFGVDEVYLSLGYEMLCICIL
jgi:hypothetical protein